MQWKLPHKVKVHEALGTIADGRVEVNDFQAKVFSSSGNKFYTVRYDKEKNAIMSNDNSSYWTGALGYPSIAVLMQVGVISFDMDVAQAFKGIKWKDVNTEFKNDFNRTEIYVMRVAQERGFDVARINQEVNRIFDQIIKLKVKVLGRKVKPPQGY